MQPQCANAFIQFFTWRELVAFYRLAQPPRNVTGDAAGNVISVNRATTL